MTQSSPRRAGRDPQPESRPLRKRLLLGPADVPPSRDDLEVIGVFNPGATELNGQVVLLVRVAERPREQRPGFVPLPRSTPEDGVTVDWLKGSEVEFLDPRVVLLRETGRLRLTFISHLLVVRLKDGPAERAECGARFLPSGPWEEFGVEDARITPLDGRFYFTYVAVSPHGAATALASTTDFHEFTRHGIIFPVENKDVVLLPERINGDYVALHRPNGHTPFTTPEMWIARSNDLIHWGAHAPLFVGRPEWASGRIGGGVPPIRTELGWLTIYHGNERPARQGDVGPYAAAVMVLDADDPSRIIRQGIKPLFGATEPFERQGFVNNVVFPTGAVERSDRLSVYYGASDTYTAVAELELRCLLSGLQAAPDVSETPSG